MQVSYSLPTTTLLFTLRYYLGTCRGVTLMDRRARRGSRYNEPRGSSRVFPISAGKRHENIARNYYRFHLPPSSPPLSYDRRGSIFLSTLSRSFPFRCPGFPLLTRSDHETREGPPPTSPRGAPLHGHRSERQAATDSNDDGDDDGGGGGGGGGDDTRVRVQRFGDCFFASLILFYFFLFFFPLREEGYVRLVC
ncbi:hypothetical protein PUN28_018289 [Cardiocondyla obscurior]|uniref:Uncharacterized protein n=1 Tax=Cardiocondyla obscurior TaxID=286306 RepID=A0AAW2EMK4_9HYME